MELLQVFEVKVDSQKVRQSIARKETCIQTRIKYILL